MKLKEKLKKKQPEKKNKGTSEKKSFKEKIKSSFNGKYIKNGSYSMLISVIFIVIVTSDQYDRECSADKIFRDRCQ